MCAVVPSSRCWSYIAEAQPGYRGAQRSRAARASRRGQMVDGARLCRGRSRYLKVHDLASLSNLMPTFPVEAAAAALCTSAAELPNTAVARGSRLPCAPPRLRRAWAAFRGAGTRSRLRRRSRNSLGFSKWRKVRLISVFEKTSSFVGEELVVQYSPWGLDSPRKTLSGTVITARGAQREARGRCFAPQNRGQNLTPGWAG